LRLRAVREQQGIDSVEQLPQLWGMMDDGKGGQRKGWHIVGAFDVENPHHPNNRQHLFRFFETILRVAHKQLHAEKKNLANCFDSFVTETIFPNACKHEPPNPASYDHLFWKYHSPKMYVLMDQYKAPLEKIYRYFSVPNPKAGVQTRDGKTLPLWKVRSASLLDNVFDFNELFSFFEKCNLFEIPMLPKPLGIIFETVTGQSGLAYQVHKNNNDNVMVLDEFYQLMFRVAMAYSNNEGYKGKTPEEVLEKYMLEFFQKCTLVMPINKAVLIKSMGQAEGLDEVILPREREITHSHFNEEKDGNDTMAVRREPLETIIDVEMAAAKLRMAGKFQDRVDAQEEKNRQAAASFGLGYEEYLKTNKGEPVRAETPDGGTPLNMWRMSPCGDGYWASEAADSYRAGATPDPSSSSAAGADEDGKASPVVAALDN
jgi:hypothetical protein